MTRIKELNKDQLYEIEKDKLWFQDLTPEEYERKIREICDRLEY